MSGAPGAGWSAPPHCRFELSPPRHFVYPAILLLLAEKPRHGYRLIDPIIGLGFGPVDRPTVYRALADLERDGLLEKWSAEPKAGATKYVYAVTESGQEALRQWMGVLAVERDQLGCMLERYALRNQLGLPHPVAPAGTVAWPARRLAVAEPAAAPAPADDTLRPAPARFAVDPQRSAILIRARSNVGAIEFGASGVRGDLTVGWEDGAVVDPSGVAARLELDVTTLTSGNSLYDAELMRRVDARLFPVAVVELDWARPVGSEDRFDVAGRVTFHGVTSGLTGAVRVGVLGRRKLVVDGEEVIDIRDFQISAPTMLMLKIYPEVRVFLHVEAHAVLNPAGAAG